MAAPDRTDQLTALLKDCLVLVSGRGEGSGFFVGPGLVATCAHVAGATGDRVTVGWRDADLPGTVRWASTLTGRGLAPYPDLAVVEVVVPPGGHPAVWLDDHLPAMSARLVVVGHARTYGPQVGRTSGWFAHGGDYEDMIRLTGDEVAPGMSGAPVLNAETGGVCAITKATRRSGQPSGGVAVPVRAIRAIMDPAPYRRLRREHDAYHRRNRRWTGLADDLPGAAGPVSRRAERELRAILSGLPATDHEQHLTTYRAVAGDLAVPPRHPLHDHGDVVSELAGLLPAEDGFPHVLAYAIDMSSRVAEQSVAESLRVWARMSPQTRRDRDEAANRLADARVGVPDAATSRIPSVLVYVRPAGQDRRRYRCELWRYEDEDDITPIATDDPDRSLEELRRHLRDRLPELARGGPDDGRRPMIELVLPYHLLDEDVDHWLEAPDRNPWSVLGQTNPVVVRELERFEEDDERLGTWRRRWKALDGQDVGVALTPVSCLERREHRALHAWFQLEPALGALVLPGSPQDGPARGALEVGLHCGVPIVVWRRRGCTGQPEISHRDCPGSRLSEAVAAEFGKAGRDDVPERIRRLRNRAGADGHPECGHDVVLLWDDPGRRLPRPRMAPPTQGAIR
ncbi:trypsin-like peptidase domain-containing protein [Micromonospora inyonensis]|uniref:Trypsin-like peptidase domain-containing protein n=1 Tax=Micromonospora inyonensis TaxID=47866 RepID=A0A1C6S8K6_9ACTN|nr:trypsin-like peptidase domain-containing protein [Micromonospora inyonensis]SCL25835.1 Trypsin-like peptidase domain-containing protein [Micromonospora inyonensis]